MCQDLPNIEVSVRGRGHSGEVKTENTLSAKICLNLNWGGGVLFWESQNSKYSMCQDLPNIEFSLGEGGYVFWGSQNSKYSKCQDLPKFEFLGGGEGGILGKSKVKIL